MTILSKDEIIKNEIIGEAQKLFCQFGVKKTTMDEIAAACGKAKSTLYHYFVNKENVFEEVIEFEMINLRKHVKDHVEEYKTVKDKLRAYTIEFHKEVIHKANLYRIVKIENISESKLKDLFYRMMEYEESYIVRILEDGLDSGELKGIDRNDISLFAKIFLAAFYGVVKYAVETDGTLDEEKLIKATDFFVPKLFV